MASRHAVERLSRPASSSKFAIAAASEACRIPGLCVGHHRTAPGVTSSIPWRAARHREASSRRSISDCAAGHRVHASLRRRERRSPDGARRCACRVSPAAGPSGQRAVFLRSAVVDGMAHARPAGTVPAEPDSSIFPRRFPQLAARSARTPRSCAAVLTRVRSKGLRRSPAGVVPRSVSPPPKPSWSGAQIL